MMWIIVIIVVIIAIIAMKKSKDEQKVNDGSCDGTVDRLVYFYGIARDNSEGLGSSVVSIGTYWFELDGKISSSSAFMSVCIRDGTNDAFAHRIGMEISTIEGKKYYQFVIKLHFSRTEKREILRRLLPRLVQEYQNDIVQFDEKIPAIYSIIESKDKADKLHIVF